MTLTPISEATSDLARWVAVLAPARQLAEVIADTEFVPKAMRGKPDMVTAAIMYGDELGLGPMQALAGMDVVEGSPRPSAELARALVLREGHTITVHDATGTRVRVSGLRAGRPEAERVTIEWTTDMARAAGLLNKSNWRSYPRAMLMARATSDLCRILFPDVIKGLSYIAETTESAQVLDQWAPPDPRTDSEVAPTPPPRQIQRRQRPPVTYLGDAPEAPPVDDGTSGAADSPVPTPPDAGGVGTSDPAPSVTDLPPEQQPAEAEDPEALATDAQRRAIFATIGRVLGPDADRRQRLALCAAILERPVESSNTITKREAYTLLAWLHELASGDVAWNYDADRGVATVWRPEHYRAGDDPLLREPDDVIRQGDDPTEDPWRDLGGQS